MLHRYSMVCFARKSAMALVPRGFGRSSFRTGEIFQMGRSLVERWRFGKWWKNIQREVPVTSRLNSCTPMTHYYFRSSLVDFCWVAIEIQWEYGDKIWDTTKNHRIIMASWKSRIKNSGIFIMKGWDFPKGNWLVDPETTLTFPSTRSRYSF